MASIEDEAFFDRVEPDVQLRRTLTALDDPARRFLLELLADCDATAGDLAASAAVNFGISAKRGSQHLRVLAEAELVDVYPDGPWRSYRIRPGGGEVVVEWLARLEQAARFD
ncbi:ArsR/SmtB family transcription factor [Demequina sp. SO4-13]|uniref:ArsR/SmtB family transcription factor n=1 Tax=Demequina sp. SO4-13 TaxID=3401027 RepID=UPI003AF8C564